MSILLISKIFILFFFFIFIFVIYIFPKIQNILNIFSKFKKESLFKLCICTIGKNENKYIREFIYHYEKLGVDKIFLYDNNNINEEKFEEVVNDFIEIGLVEVFNWRGVKIPQHKFMKNCYNKNYKIFDWLIFYDIDEFIYLYNYSNIKNFLNEKKFLDCQVICLNLLEHTDNNLLYYENNSLFNRFKEVENIYKKKKLPSVKPILKGHIPNIKIRHIHTLNNDLIICNGFGHKNKVIISLKSTEPDYKYYYIHHFFSKSTEEFINKIKRGDAIYIAS